jgi:serine phosphatase RsbU (regulator of sigma subunit)
LQAAREIQNRLVPVDLPEIEGCRVLAAYVPAAEVGGDFFQVLQHDDGSALIAVGDVSGKGLRAAMTGALTIGALRTLADQGMSPAKLLRALNRQLVQAGQGGFVTLLCARLSPDGALTVANAGHLYPYRNGTEVALETGMPLGISMEVDYAETTLQLQPDDSITFLSDGVVEARRADGELFGFERTQAISGRSPQEIADAAQEFGQEDDITVLKLTLAPVGVLA